MMTYVRDPEGKVFELFYEPVPFSTGPAEFKTPVS